MSNVIGFDNLRQFFSNKNLNKNEMYLHEKKVEIAKLTPERWERLFGTLDKLPGLIAQILSAPEDSFYAYVVTAVEMSLNEIVEVVSVLSDIDKDYIHKNVGVDEILEYLQRTVKLNRLDTVAKNVKSLLPKK